MRCQRGVLRNVQVAGAAFVWVAVAVTADSQTTREIAVEDARPLRAVLDELERAHCWIVTYEDPPYIFSGDTRDATREVARTFDASRPPILVPDGQRWAFAYEREVPRGNPEPRQVLRTLLDAYHSSGNPGVFDVVDLAGALHVVPKASRDSSGVLQPRSSLLGVRIAVTPHDDSVLESVKAVVRAVSDATGTQVVLGTVPFNLFAQRRIRPEERPGVARDVLMRALAATGQALTWRLLCQPGTNECALNVRRVCDPGRPPEGST
jgi:hypothetical protein